MIDIFLENDGILIIVLAALSILAGFIDAVVGGGGLITIPALLIGLPKTALPTIFGTNKIAALAGTSVSAVKYARKIHFNYSLLFYVGLTAAISSFIGARAVQFINVNTLKPIILIILIVIAIYTFVKKDLGNAPTKELSDSLQIIYGSFIALIVGFYDGFFGPGTGSFLVLGFVLILGFDFIQASAYSKIINCITNFSALIVFIKNGNYILHIAIILALANMLGNYFGTHVALKKGNKFVRIIYLIVVSIMIVRYGYDVFN